MSALDVLATRDMLRATAMPGVETFWNFSPSRPALGNQLKRFVMRPLRAKPRPPQAVIKPVVRKKTWAVYFVFCPDGRLQTYHRFTLARLRETGWPVLAICATPNLVDVPEELAGCCDALYWKGLSGYDFSAYTLALEVLAEGSPGADVFVMNDSIYGPFTDLRAFMAQSPWELTGFTASSDTMNHVQSYAFILKNLTPDRLELLREAFPSNHAFDNAGDAILWQELCFATIAARSLRVGAFWFGTGGVGCDPTLTRPFELLDAGFPFLKRSLLGKHGKFQSRDRVRKQLAELGHELPA